MGAWEVLYCLEEGTCVIPRFVIPGVKIEWARFFLFHHEGHSRIRAAQEVGTNTLSKP